MNRLYSKLMQSKLLPYLLVLLVLESILAGVAYLNQSTSIAFNESLSTKEDLVYKVGSKARELKGEKEAVTTELSQKESELTTKQTEFSNLSTEYSQKLKQLDDANRKIKDLQGQLTATSNEITKLRTKPPVFTFKVESSNISNVEQKKEDIKSVVTNAFPIIEDVYSKAYLLHSVTISFVDTLSVPGAYAEVKITNGTDGLSINIRITDFDKNKFDDINAILHEIIHAFHGLAALDSPAYEEGITVAATDVVMEKLIAQNKIDSFNPLYIRLSSDSYYSTSLTLPNDRSFYTDTNNAAQYYQIAGYGWYQIYKADSNFFKTFNEKLYKKVREGETVNDATVKQLIKDSTTNSIHGKTISEWLETKAFNLR